MELIWTLYDLRPQMLILAFALALTAALIHLDGTLTPSESDDNSPRL